MTARRKEEGRGKMQCGYKEGPKRRGEEKKPIY